MRSQPPLGKYRSIISRHTLTGRRRLDSLCHGTGVTDTPASSSFLVNTVPLKRKISGISPSSRACMYFVDVMSKSYVHATGRSTSVSPTKPEMIALAWVQRKGRSDCAQLGVSPKTARKLRLKCALDTWATAATARTSSGSA